MTARTVPTSRPRVSPPRFAQRVTRGLPAPTPSAATIVVEVAVSGTGALEAATRLAGEIRDLVDSTGTETPGVDVSAAVGLEIGSAPRSAHSGRPPLSSVGPLSSPAVDTTVPTAPKAANDNVSGAALKIFPARRVALIEGQQMLLTRREFDLLLFLAERAGRVFDRPQLLRLVWGHQVICGERTVDVHVRRLRAKFGRTGPVISTVRGVGYRLDAPERVAVVHEAG